MTLKSEVDQTRGSARHECNHVHANLMLVASKSNLNRGSQPQVDHGPYLFPVLARSSNETTMCINFFQLRKAILHVINSPLGDVFSCLFQFFQRHLDKIKKLIVSERPDLKETSNPYLLPSNTQTLGEIIHSKTPNVAPTLYQATRQQNDFNYTCTQPQAKNKEARFSVTWI